MPGATTFDRILVIAIGTLIALFTFGTVSTLVTSATADNVNVNRDDHAVEVESVEDDEDDPRDRFRDGSRDRSRDNSNRGSRGTRDNSRGSRDKSRSRESNTTRGTGPSNTNTRDTKTGTRTRNSR
jgi:hypothetical protein